MISVLIATYNRGSFLNKILKDLVTQEEVTLGEDFEVIIADNNSIDNTRTIVERYIREYGESIRYIFQPKQGKPYALNIAIPEAKGNWILFLDDDVRVDRRFMRIALGLINEAEEKEVVLIGGKVDPLLEVKKPDWLSDRYWGCLAVNSIKGCTWLLDKTEIQRIKPWNSIFGANMMVKKEIFDVVGLYSEVHRYAQDTEIAKRICDAGYKVLLTDKIRVKHHIPSSRLTKDYIRLWFYRRGFIFAVASDYKKKWYHFLGVPWEVVVKYFIYTFYAVIMIGNDSKLKWEIKTAWYKGMMHGFRKKLVSN